MFYKLEDRTYNDFFEHWFLTLYGNWDPKLPFKSVSRIYRWIINTYIGWYCFVLYIYLKLLYKLQHHYLLQSMQTLRRGLLRAGIDIPPSACRGIKADTVISLEPRRYRLLCGPNCRSYTRLWPFDKALFMSWRQTKCVHWIFPKAIQSHSPNVRMYVCRPLAMQFFLMDFFRLPSQEIQECKRTN